MRTTPSLAGLTSGSCMPGPTYPLISVAEPHEVEGLAIQLKSIKGQGAKEASHGLSNERIIRNAEARLTNYFKKEERAKLAKKAVIAGGAGITLTAIVSGLVAVVMKSGSTATEEEEDRAPIIKNLLTWNMQGSGRFGQRTEGRVFPLSIPTFQFLPYIHAEMGPIDIFCLQEGGNLVELLNAGLTEHITFGSIENLGGGRALERFKLRIKTPHSVMPPTLQRDLEVADAFHAMESLVIYGYNLYWDSRAGRVNLLIASRAKPDYWDIPGSRDGLHLLENPASRDWNNPFTLRPILGMRVDGKWYYTIHNSSSRREQDIPGFAAAVRRPCVIAGDYNVEADTLQAPRGTTRHNPNSYTLNARGRQGTRRRLCCTGS